MISVIYEALLKKINSSLNQSILYIIENDEQFEQKFSRLENKKLLIKIKNFLLDLEFFVVFNKDNIKITDNKIFNNNLRIKEDCADLTVKISLSSLVKAKLDSVEEAIHSRDIEFDGDLNLAMSLQGLLDNSNIDVFEIIQENLEQYTGKYFAWEFINILKNISSRIQAKNAQFSEQVADYLLTEQELIANKYELEDYYNNVDTFRDDVDRLAVKIRRLEYAS